MNWIMQRLNEASTWRGFCFLVLGIGLMSGFIDLETAGFFLTAAGSFGLLPDRLDQSPPEP